MKTKTKKIMFIISMLLMTSLIITQMMFVWAIDVSTGAIWRDNVLNNGFSYYDPVTIYHIGLFGVIIITGLLFMIVMIMLFSQFNRIKVQT